MAWHPPGAVPAGQPHGANAFCVTVRGNVVLVSTDGSRWGWPGGRPERGESWEDTLRRELNEEACATVTRAGYSGSSGRNASAGMKKDSSSSARSGGRR